ncbi:Histidine kinase-, DNA gyrase B-, and HSP90-like ATPase [Paenibacillus sp. UNCCL117]|uniref:cache domain-containing sensor histidine kinase n=1 Tax=unclassified Paenibacillus TaxID=185978 RepID=UPI0008876441|nr:MULTISPECIES: histidine kinase [unclassified Paenibacillus]SDD90347.1 Histidine kinase-, DNA gyrase B-, and HSP90-like ATPase [Paenibacillus sp. cl123]SFW43939.1 Histidine kinase-, DNA gyrase B-, and HSP90-like ATPase [Paenibacillus sp. UNCCL117]
MHAIKKTTFWRNFIWLILLVLTPIMLLNTYYFFYWSHDIKQQEMDNDTKFLTLAGQSLDTILNDITQLISLLEFDDTLNDAIEGLFDARGQISPAKYIYLNNVLENTFRTFIGKPYIHSAYFYHEKNDKFIFTTEGIRNLSEIADKSWLDSYQNTDEEAKYWAELRPFPSPSAAQGHVDMLSLFRKVPIFSDYGNGVIVLNLNRTYFDSLFQNIPNIRDKKIYMMDGNHKILYGNTPEPIGEVLTEADLLQLEQRQHLIKKNGKDTFLVSYVESKVYDWKYVSILPTVTLLGKLEFMKKMNLLILALSLVIGLLLALRYTVKTYRPIQMMVRIIRHHNEGKEIGSFRVNENDEYGFITLNIIRSFLAKNDAMRQLTESMLLQREAELHALQSQINPHFLYNILETINWEAMNLLGRDNLISALMLRLSSNLRYVTDSRRSVVSLEEDLRHVRDYIYMQEMLHQHRFSVIYRVDQAALNRPVLKLLIQPLVENSVQHGMAERVSGGRIKLAVELRAALVRIRIIDNGGGMAKEKLAQLRAVLAAPSPSSPTEGRSVGIANVNQRLKLKYGAGYELRVVSTAGRGTAVTLEFPSETAAE